MIELADVNQPVRSRRCLAPPDHWRTKVLRCLAAALLVVYLGWNAYWLAQGVFAPSLFKAITGLPCPTTGGTRSLHQLRAGNVVESLRYNAMTVPLLALFVLSVVWPIGQVLRGRRTSLPAWLVGAWGAILLIAWILKLAGDPRYW